MRDPMKMAHVYIVSAPRGERLVVKVAESLTALFAERETGSLPGLLPEHENDLLVWVEACETVVAAVPRQRTIQKWPRQRKIGFIDAKNPEWADITGSLLPP